MTQDKTKRIAKRAAAKIYASTYDEANRKVALGAFMDGIIFWDMVKPGAVTEDMIDADFFAILSESNHKKEEI